MGDKDPVIDETVPALQPILHIVQNTLFVAATVLLDDLHFTVNNLDTGLQVQKVCAQRHHHGAASALYHIVQPIQQKAGLNPIGKVLELIHDLFWGKNSIFGHFYGFADHMSVAAGEVSGVNHINPLPQHRRSGSRRKNRR